MSNRHKINDLPSKQQLGKAIRLYRVSNDLTQETLANWMRQASPGLKTHQKRVSQLENGQREPNRLEILALATIFEVPIADICYANLPDAYPYVATDKRLVDCQLEQN